MQFLLYTIYVIHVLVSIFLILVVLLQQGQGADLAVFGGGSTQAAFGARSATTVLHKLTVGGFILFIATTLSIALLQTRGGADASIIPASAASSPADEAEPVDPAAQDDALATEGATAEGSAPEETVPADDDSTAAGTEPPAADGDSDGEQP